MLAAQRAQASLSIAAVYFSLLLLKHGRRVSVLCPSRAQRNTEMFSILYFEGCKSVKAAIVLLETYSCVEQLHNNTRLPCQCVHLW